MEARRAADGHRELPCWSLPRRSLGEIAPRDAREDDSFVGGRPFDEAVERQQQLEPTRNLNRRQWSVLFVGLPMCVRYTGTILKMSRWCSGNQMWAEVRPQFWFLHLVFDEIAEDADCAPLVIGEPTALWDKNVPAQAKGCRVNNTRVFQRGSDTWT